jgi:hypothetical protein
MAVIGYTSMRPPLEDINTGNTGTIFDTQSYAWVLLDWIFNQLSTDPFFVNFAVKRISSALPVELWSQVPFLGIFINDEPLSPVGYINESTIRFTHNVQIGFQTILRNNDSVQLLQDLDGVSWFIMRKLFRLDPLTNMFDTGSGVALKGIARGRVSKPRYGLSGSKNETPVAERVLDLTFQFESEWYPYGFDDLQRITVTTAFPIGGTTEEQTAVEQVKIVYEFNPDSVPNPLPPDLINTVAPVVTGSTSVGSVLTTDNGIWSNSPTSYAYQWQKNGFYISGATNSSYTIESGDVGVGSTIGCVVTATNAEGSANANSNTVVIP